MNTKERLLSLLEENKGRYLSGEEIAGLLSVSRTSIWKAINSLKLQGYEINAVTNKGYCLSESSDILSKFGVEKHLKHADNFEIRVFPSITSTNTALRKLAMEGEKEGLILAAFHQTEGKGRRGRSFYSPEDTGVYFSILLRPDDSSINKTNFITTMAASAVSLAIDNVFSVDSKIKWVNDIFVDNKKVCGILTEASIDVESQSFDFAVLGIGINIYAPKNGFPKDIKSIAGHITKKSIPDGKNRLVAETINNFWKFYTNNDNSEYLKIYRDKSLVIGKTIEVIKPSASKSAKAISIDDECHLLVEYPDKTREVLSSGEISIKI